MLIVRFRGRFQHSSDGEMENNGEEGRSPLRNLSLRPSCIEALSLASLELRHYLVGLLSKA